MLSVVIPLFNAQKTIGLVLKALVSQKIKEAFEIIIVDDGSKDSSKEKVENLRLKLKIKNLKLFSQKHQGPAAARNFGVNKAKGDIIVFLDADVILEDSALKQIVYDFRTKKNLVALNGVYSLEPAIPSFFSWYFSLFKYYQWVCRKTKAYTGFSTRLAAIKKNVFLKVGGFNKVYRDALVEDYDFGHRLGKNYKVIVDPKVKGKHFHPNFSQCFCNYYKRAYLWLKLFGQRKKFDNITTTFSTGLASVFGFLTLIFLPLTIFYKFSIFLLIPFSFSFMIFLGFYWRFYLFVFREKGVLWLFAAVIITLVLTIPLGLAFFKFLLVDKLAFKIRKAVI